MHVIPVVSTKGGEGKSTKAANLAGFTADAGLRTLLIDGDHAQPTASSIYELSYEAPMGLYELLMQAVDLNQPDQIISRSVIDNLDVIISNDPNTLLPTAMLHAPDGRLRLRNQLQHPLFSSYDVIIVDSQGARSIMLELILMAATSMVLAVVKPVLPDIREFIRGTVGIMEGLLPFTAFGLKLPEAKILVNCLEYTTLDLETLAELENIVRTGQYSDYAGDIRISLLNTKVYALNVYKRGHALGQPAHRLETTTARVSDSAFHTMHSLACELFPQWRERFDNFARMTLGPGK